MDVATKMAAMYEMGRGGKYEILLLFFYKYRMMNGGTFFPSHSVYDALHCMQFLTMLLKYQFLSVYRIAEWVT